jgi:hypothetical protein
MSEIRKMICVDKVRGFDGEILSYNLIEYGDKERLVRNYSPEYIETAIRRKEMIVSNLKLNPAGGLLFVDHNQNKTKVVLEDDDDTESEESSVKKKRKTYRRKKSYAKSKKKR